MIKARSTAGFTLIETILSLALTALVVGILALTSKQFLLTWQTGLASLDDAEALTLVEMAVRRDFESLAQFSPVHGRLIYSFEGHSNSLRMMSKVPRPEVGRPFIAIEFRTIDGKGFIRATTPYDGAGPLAKIQFPKGEKILPPKYDVRFSYQDEGGREVSEWQNGALPQLVTIELRGPDGTLLAIWPIRLAPYSPAPCARAVSLKACYDFLKVGQQGAVQ